MYMYTLVQQTMLHTSTFHTTQTYFNVRDIDTKAADLSFFHLRRAPAKDGYFFDTAGIILKVYTWVPDWVILNRFRLISYANKSVLEKEENGGF